MSKIALAMIVKGDDREAALLDRCLQSTKKHVDGMFITVTQPNTAVEEVVKKHKGMLSHFEWVNDFAAARNFNFSQVPKEFTHILWCDADDVFRGLENLRNVIDDHPSVDCFVFHYLYSFDEYKLPTAVHLKTQVVRNNGCVKWAGKLHEDFAALRQLDSFYVKGIERIHLTTDERIAIAKDRNEEISKESVEANPDDPREYWNYANSLFGAAKFKECIEVFRDFIKRSSSDDEKYIAHLRIVDAAMVLKQVQQALDSGMLALGMKPTYPDAYFALGRVYYNTGDYKKAEEYYLTGLVQKKPYFEIVVYNPRDYDYNPMMMLARIYILQGRPDLALTMMEGCIKIYPQDSELKKHTDMIRAEVKKLEKALLSVKKLEGITDEKKFAAALKKLPPIVRSHPTVCLLANQRLVKKESSGKDLVIYCGMTDHEWNPELFKTKGFGGSEEAVVHMSRELKNLGWNVTVYASCGFQEQDHDGVLWKPFWSWNYRDKQDVVIIWRNPKPLDFDINASKIFLDMHDVVPAGELDEDRVAKLTKILVKSEFHRSLFPAIDDSKFAVIPNGADLSLFTDEVERNPYLLVNTSSPDRSMDVLPELFMRVKAQVPEARLRWAYGWEMFDNFYASDQQKMEWKSKTLEKIKEAGIEDCGRLPQHEAAKLYLEGNILAYPTDFAEIDCISVRKAQAAGCLPITTDFSAINETNQHGVKVKSQKTKDNYARDFKFTFGIEEEEVKQAWVDAVVQQLKQPVGDRSEMKQWAQQFTWDKIAQRWNTILSET